MGDDAMKKTATVEEQLKKMKKRFFILLTFFILFLTVVGIYIYLNYDYLAFKHLISQNYIYTDTLDDIFKKELKRDVNGNYYSYFDNLVISVVTKYIQSANNDRYTYLYLPENLKQVKEEEKEEASQSEIKELNDKTVLLRLTNFSKYTQKFVLDNTEKLDDYPYLILDLRDNYGGDIDAMARISDVFLPKGKIIATDRMRIFNRIYKAKYKDMLKYERIMILQNENTASASENMIAALKDNLENVTLLGQTTFGKGIGQFTLPLRRGYAVKATVLFWDTPNNINIQGKGISPDIFYDGEDAVDYALSIIDDI
ncbi:hypothetical protein CDQ83_04095 [Clostridium thermosuccinogenes]|nr:hypothetical protein CDQ83_04095 [Pseudoclostridium thermosuccinogenes]